MNKIVALIGRPNVGKSTLFNRITRSKDALVDDMPGVTRDRNYGKAEWEGHKFTLVDTGGFSDEDEQDFVSQIRFQAELAIEEADVIVVVFDGKAGLSPFDHDLINSLRGINKPVMYIVNKIDGLEQEHKLLEFYETGVSPIYPVSAEHRYGVFDFLDELIKLLPSGENNLPEEMIKIAVVGRPNVGKSSLINKLLGEERVMVSNIPGTTRDSIDTVFEYNEKSYLLIDTAGIRRKGKVNKKLEKFSIIKSFKSLDRCDIALILIDANEGITDQDIRVAGYAYERKCGCIFLINKWDLIKEKKGALKKYLDNLRYQSKFLNFAPAMTVSALTGFRVMKIFKHIDEVYEQFQFRINTGKLNKIFENAIYKNEPSLTRGRRIKFYYFTQVSAKPPTFVCFVNYPDAVHFSYKRYLVNYIRQETGLDKTPIKIYYRKRDRIDKKKK